MKRKPADLGQVVGKHLTMKVHEEEKQCVYVYELFFMKCHPEQDAQDFTREKLLSCRVCDERFTRLLSQVCVDDKSSQLWRRLEDQSQEM